MIRDLFTRHHYVIVPHGVGRPGRWFRYHPHRVWVWTKDPGRALRFRSREEAAHAAESCSLAWEHVYRIEAVPKR